MKPLWDALYHAGAEVVLNGHDHDYDASHYRTLTVRQTHSMAFREFVVGSGGKNSHRTMGKPKPNSEIRNDDTFGVLKLTLHANGYDWQFVPEAGKDIYRHRFRNVPLTQRDFQIHSISGDSQ